MRPPLSRLPVAFATGTARRISLTAMLLLLIFASTANGESVTARLDWAQQTQLSTPLSGIIAEVNGTPGALVAKGELLVRLDDREWRAELARAEAGLDEAKALKQEAERELERNQELYDRTVLSDHALRLAEIEAARANAAWRLAQAGLTRARLKLEWTRVSAPFDARILSVAKKPGEVIISRFQAEPLMTIAARDRLLAKAQVSARTAALLNIGDTIKVALEDGEMKGQLASISQDPNGGNSYRIEVALPRNSENLFAGQMVRLDLP